MNNSLRNSWGCNCAAAANAKLKKKVKVQFEIEDGKTKLIYRRGVGRIRQKQQQLNQHTSRTQTAFHALFMWTWSENVIINIVGVVQWCNCAVGVGVCALIVCIQLLNAISVDLGDYSQSSFPFCSSFWVLVPASFAQSLAFSMPFAESAQAEQTLFSAPKKAFNEPRVWTWRTERYSAHIRVPPTPLDGEQLHHYI